MKDEWYFRQLDQQYANEPCGRVVLTGSVPAWECECFHWNGVNVPTCNNCGAPKPSMALIKSQLCVECRKPTNGSIGQAGYFWLFLCQPCKDFADGYLRGQVQTQAILMQAIDRVA